MKTILYLMICFWGALFSPTLIPQNNQAIIIVESDWSSQLVVANLLGLILQNQGYEVKFRPSSNVRQFEALGKGLMHVQPEVWQGTDENEFRIALQKGYIRDAGAYQAKSREDWWYPDYVGELCKGLPDWTALRNCEDLFKKNRNDLKASFLGGPWEINHQNKADALELNYKVLFAQHAETLWAELELAVSQKRPILLFNWTPNSIEYKYPGAFVEFPEYHHDCELLPEWGLNPEKTHDCGNPKNGWIKKVVSHDFEQKWPCAFQIIKNMDFDSTTLSTFAGRLDFDGLDRVQAATKWLSENEKLWKSWVPKVCHLIQ